MGQGHLYYGFPLMEVSEITEGLGLGPSKAEAEHIVWVRSLRDAQAVESALNVRAAKNLFDPSSARWSFKLVGTEPVGAELGIELDWLAKEQVAWRKRKAFEKLANPFRYLNDQPKRSVIRCKRVNSMGAKTPLYYLEIL